ncbi:Werner syndrome-like exonuclease [Thalictrum thalictroides]|uniref:Werner syndrome-like exonuclease n=1 Tax=Thalictrum thalictroides TaxID=46969 RepID=A0A7J6XDA2_THATH|nr:Werner syndrome-like exonuclease [Thalictrum thalictroides]
MSISIQDIDSTSMEYSTYTVTIFNEVVHTVVTCTPTKVDEFITEILNTHQNNPFIVGLDIEWRPNFNRNIDNPVATLQLCIGRKCLIFQFLYAPSIPKSLIDFLNNPSYKFVGIGIDEDVEKLLLDYSLRVANPVDLRSFAVNQLNRNELKNAGLKEMARVVLDMEISKPKRVTMSRWDVEWLTYDQVQYACVDAFLSFEIGMYMAGAAGHHGDTLDCSVGWDGEWKSSGPYKWEMV